MKDPWFDLRRYTQARIGQGRAGCATPTNAHLDFQLAHAMARDALHQTWQVESFAGTLNAEGSKAIILTTPIMNREHYLLRPDLGCCLDAASQQFLEQYVAPPFDIVLIVTNGLSSAAVEAHGLRLLEAIREAYAACSLDVGPIWIVPNARVALIDEIGEILKARFAVIIVGERPGLSAADSLGIYLTHTPRRGKTNAERNCISNIRPPQGLDYKFAATKLTYLTLKALDHGVSGVALKDDMPSHFGLEDLHFRKLE